MSDPKRADNKPFVIERLEEGTYYWCACGKSNSQPYCDGSHQGSEFSPKEVVIGKARNVAYCMCKLTKTAPFCDGSHAN
jgi:CDGSH-type Zn-finger protein